MGFRGRGVENFTPIDLQALLTHSLSHLTLTGRLFKLYLEHMGKKGDKLTNTSTMMAEYLVEQAADLGEITSKKMFGGHGVFTSGKMFAMVDSEGRVYLKADETNRSEFELNGGVKHSRMPYYSVPDNIIDRPALLKPWIESALTVASS